MRLNFRLLGEGPPLVVLHGLFGSSDNWSAVGQQFASRFRVFALDQRNHGGSPKAPEMNYRLMAEDLAEFMDEHGLAACHVLGHSMGGKTAMQFALDHPGRVLRLVVVDISVGQYAPRHQGLLEAMLALDLAQYASRAQVEAALASAIPDRAVRQFLLKSLERRSNGSLVWKLGLREISRNYSALNSAVESSNRFPGPALFVRGQHSDYLTTADFDEVRRLFPQASLRTVPDAGHWVHAENPRVFVELVCKFLVGEIDARFDRE